MASNSLKSLHHNHHSILKRNTSVTALSAFSSSLFLRHDGSSRTFTSVSHSLSSTVTTSSLSPATIFTASTCPTISFEQLQHHLSTGNFREADEETRRLLIVLAGDAAQKRGYVYFSEVQFISETDLRTIDELWRNHSGGKFGYSVQKKIFEKVNEDFTKFFIKVGWMKKLDTEVEQYNYRSFPTEFIWELNYDTPEGHLPLTNALRGTLLLNRILSHPAFNNVEENNKEEGKAVDYEGDKNGGLIGLRDGSKSLSKNIFKTDYSF